MKLPVREQDGCSIGGARLVAAGEADVAAKVELIDRITHFPR